MKYLITIPMLLLAHINLLAQDTLNVAVNTTKTDSTLEIRVRVRIDSGWAVKANPEMNTCCFKRSIGYKYTEPIKEIGTLQGGLYYNRVIFVKSIPLKDLDYISNKDDFSGYIILIACKDGECLDPDTRKFKIKL